MERTFSESKQRRDECFSGKDDVTVPILRSIPIPRPRGFRAVLMPSLYGPEVYYLRAAGVPGENVFAIERDPEVWGVLSDPPQELEHLEGIQTTSRPMALHEAVEHIPWRNPDLVYLDLFGQPDTTHLKALFRLFRLYTMKPGSVLMMTCGRNRGAVFSCRLNARLITENAGQAYVEASILEAGHRMYRTLRVHEYTSDNINFTITEVRF